MAAVLLHFKKFTNGIYLRYIFVVYTHFMKSLSLKLDESVYAETEKITKALKVPRNRYINAALSFYNAQNKKLILTKSFARESLLVRENSMVVLQEMESIDTIHD